MLPRYVSKNPDSSIISSIMAQSSDSTMEQYDCPSLNIGVRSMSFEFPCNDSLSDIEIAVFPMVLREALEALEVLRGTVQMNPKLQFVAPYPPPRTIVKKKNTCLAIDEKEMYFGEDAGFVATIPTIREKLLKNRDLVYNVLYKIVCNFEEEGNFNSLKDEVNVIIESKEKECNLNINLKIWSDLIVKLQEMEKTFEEKFEIEKQKYLEEINKLAEDIDRSYCYNIDKLDYIMKWEASKLEQQNIRLSLQVEELLDQIKELEKERIMDSKVSLEVQFYGKMVINAFELDIKNWSKRFNDEMEKRQMDATEVEENIEAIKIFIEESRKVQEERQVVLDIDFAEKKKVLDEKEYWRLIHESATLIQAIWRGYMVRHRLGRYAEFGYKRKKPKRKNARKKSKKSKKKK